MTFLLTKNTTNTLKFLSAVIVMLHHFSQYVCARGLSDHIFYKALSSQGGFIGVAVFFFLSGYGLMESEQKSHLNIQTFFKRRFLKVYLPVLCVTFLWMIVSPFVCAVAPFYGYEIEIWGGKSLIISNILISFGDDVLWFVKALIYLYVAFYLFRIIFIRNKPIGITFLCCATALITYLAYKTMGDFTSISVPIFSLGVIVSLLKHKKYSLLIVVTSLVFLFVAYWRIYDKALAIHSGLNIIFILLLLFIFSIKKIDIKMPAILGLISFDLYLVHNKVLMAMQDQFNSLNLWVYILTVAIFASSSYILRKKLLNIQ